MRDIKHEDVTRVLNYDKETGVFNWKIQVSNVKKGAIAGKVSHTGHIEIRINYTYYLAHRLAWFYVHKVWPQNELDHINGVGSDNRLSNLREATRAQNVQNQRRAHKSNRIGFLGVSQSGKKSFRASIRANNVKYSLGRFSTPELAHEAYLKAKRELHEFCTI